MTLATDALLAQLSLDAYSDAPVPLPAGVTALDAASLPIALAPDESFANGVFHGGNGAALVTQAVLDGVPSIVIAFRGSDDATDSQQDLNGINAAYGEFGSLVAAVDAAAAATGAQVVVTGHSLGGAIAQLYMAGHPDQPGGTVHDAVTFGSPGAILPAATDARITNYAIADDPSVVLGAHRAEFGALLRADPTLANLAATEAARELPGMTREQALASLGNLTVNYDNHGNIVLLPGQDGRLDPAGDLANLARLDFSRHAPELYAADLAALASGDLASTTLPEAPSTDPQTLLLQAIYDGSHTGTALSDSVVDGLVQDYLATHQTLGPQIDSLLNQAQSTVANIQHDLPWL